VTKNAIFIMPVTKFLIFFLESLKMLFEKWKVTLTIIWTTNDGQSTVTCIRTNQ